VTESGNAGEVVTYWFDKADAALASARSERLAGRPDFAVNRAYFAAFYAASAVLFARGRRFVKHTGVRAAVHRDLVKSGLLAPELGRVFDRLFGNRQRADYLDLVHFETEEVVQLIEEAGAFVSELKRLAP
jgi:uncharacterized protein (UPF0332 family)